MKKYTSREARWLALLSVISAAILVTGITLCAIGSPNISFPIGFILSGGMMSILFLSCYLAEKSRALVMDADKIIFPRGAERNGKMIFQKSVVRLGEIRSVESRLHKGDGIISKDCYFHTLKLKDGTKLTVTLYAYGSEAEKEILKAIQARI